MNDKHFSSRSLKWNSRRRYLLYGVLILVLLVGVLYFIRWWQGENPNVLLISIDTLRRDHCTPYGYERNTTPNLQVLAEQGAVFDLAYAPSATTAPSHVTMLTSLYPIGHQVLDNGWVLTEDAYTLAEHLGAHGYQTAAFVSSSVLDKRFGFAQGFTFFDDDFSSSKSTVHQKLWDDLPEGLDRRADDTTGKVIDWLKQQRDPDQPFFLFIHYFDPHDPYVPPKDVLSKLRPKGKRLTKLENQILKYDGEIMFTDREIGKLLGTLEQLGLKEETLVVVTSDHGEGLGQHGHMYHSINIYEEQVRVPLIFRYPAGIPAG
jgi:arylsulfatase A-like enzyme